VGKFQLEPLLNDVVETLAKLLSAEACSVYLIDDDGMLRIKAGAGYSKRLLAPGEHRVKGGEVVKTPAEYRLGEGVTGSIAKEGGVCRTTKRKIHRDNPGWKGKYDEVQWPRGGRCISFLGIPLKVRDMVIGVLKVENKKRGEDFVESFTKDDETLMEILGNIVAISVENVRTSEDAALSAERMQAWHGVSAAAAHRLGNILPYTEARLKDARNGRGDVKELLSLCYEDIRSAMRILADFKTFARPPEIRPVPISLRELFGTVSELSRAEGVETEIDWPEGDCRLVLDPFAMKLIFQISQRQGSLQRFQKIL
jgi:GAF domain-containing protein